MIQAQVKIVREGEGVPIWMCGALYETKLVDEDSGGRMSVFKTSAPPNTLIAPLHRHMVADEILFVVSGKVVSFTGLNCDQHELHPGDFIFLPRGTWEGFMTTDAPAEMFWFIFPGSGSELFFSLVGTPAQERILPPETYVNPSLETLRDFSQRAGFQEVDGRRP